LENISLSSTRFLTLSPPLTTTPCVNALHHHLPPCRGQRIPPALSLSSLSSASLGFRREHWSRSLTHFTFPGSPPFRQSPASAALPGPALAALSPPPTVLGSFQEAAGERGWGGGEGGGTWVECVVASLVSRCLCPHCSQPHTHSHPPHAHPHTHPKTRAHTTPHPPGPPTHTHFLPPPPLRRQGSCRKFCRPSLAPSPPSSPPSFRLLLPASRASPPLLSYPWGHSLPHQL